MKRAIWDLLSGAGAAALLASPALALAQETPPGDFDNEIVVTGTSIRGVAPAGASVIGLTDEDVLSTGATSTAQVLASIPQLSDFGETPTIQGGNNYRLSTNRPNLRNLPGGVTSTSATLILMDGHRLPGSGVLQTFADPDIIPPTLIQRVEAVPDGGSSIYGADAVGGVINFITRREFEGLQVKARYGLGDEFNMWDGSVTAGHDFGETSAFIAYAYAQRDPIFSRDRDYVQNIDWVTGLPTERRCNPGNVTIAGVTSPLPGLSGAPNLCDPSEAGTLFGKDRRESVMGGLSADLTADMRFDIRAWYTARSTSSDGGPLRATALVPAASPYSIDAANPQSVAFDFSPVAPSTYQTSSLETLGFTPEITWDVSENWQLRAFLNYGISRTVIHNPTLNTTLFNTYVTSGLINPYDLNDPANAARVIEALSTQETYGRGEDEIAGARFVLDGPLFDLPGGEVRLAYGGEYSYERYEGATEDGFPVGGTPRTFGDARDAASAFMEFNLPVIGEGNRLPFAYSLALSLSARYDDYSDFGERTSPRVGLTFEPVEWISLRGHWGESFQAPGLADTARAISTYRGLVGIPTPVLVDAVDTGVLANQPGYNLFVIQGAASDLQPQEATTWTVGFDIRPPIIPGLELSATYYDIDYQGRISSPIERITSLFRDYPDLVTKFPSVADIQGLYGSDPNAASAIATLLADGDPVYAIFDVRSRNAGNDRIKGMDYSLRYSTDTDFGSLFATVNAAYLLEYKTSVSATAPLSGNRAGVDGNNRLNLSATIGGTWGEHWLARATLNHIQGTSLLAPLGGLTASTIDDQTRVDDFDVVNLFFQYDVLGQGWGEDLSFNLSVNNVADEDPPIYRGVWPGNFSQAGYQGSTLGRVVQVGVSKTF